MACCGKNIVRTGVNIAKGFTSLAVGKRYAFTDDRLIVCRSCDRGYLKKEQITRMFCSECKCFIPAKARVKDEMCPLDRWPDIKGVLKNG